LSFGRVSSLELQWHGYSYNDATSICNFETMLLLLLLLPLNFDSVKHRRNTDATSSSTDLSSRWYDTALYMNSHAARDLSLTKTEDSICGHDPIAYSTVPRCLPNSTVNIRDRAVYRKFDAHLIHVCTSSARIYMRANTHI
jgi:hypothetical protein